MPRDGVYWMLEFLRIGSQHRHCLVCGLSLECSIEFFLDAIGGPGGHITDPSKSAFDPAFWCVKYNLIQTLPVLEPPVCPRRDNCGIKPRRPLTPRISSHVDIDRYYALCQVMHPSTHYEPKKSHVTDGPNSAHGSSARVHAPLHADEDGKE